MLGVLVRMICHFKTAVMPVGRGQESRGQAEADSGYTVTTSVPCLVTALRSLLHRLFTTRGAGRQCASEDGVCGGRKVSLRLK